MILNKTQKIIATTVGVVAIMLYFDSFITYNYPLSSQISSDWHSLSRYTLALLSAIVFVRGLYGFKQDKKYHGVLGYHWKTKEPIQLLNEQQKIDTQNDKLQINLWTILIKYSVYILIAIGIIVGLFVLEVMFGYPLSSYRTVVNHQDTYMFNGVSLWGDSQVVFNLIAIIEVFILAAFTAVFARGTIGFYHDYIASSNLGFSVVFEDIKAPFIDKLIDKYKNIRASKESKVE